jgi:hypothetical protein
VQVVRLRIEGALSGSSYGGGITSNVVEVKIPWGYERAAEQNH